MKTKLILYDVFSYSCMNCLRSAEYIKKIDSRYKKYGLETIIIHPPEWEFEKESENISANLKQNNIPFPFIPDKERKRIHEFGINFWPTQLLVREEQVLYKHIGEGNYKELEENIIEILKIKQKVARKIFTKEPIYSKYPTVYCGSRKKGIVVLAKNIDKSSLDFGINYTQGKWEQEPEFVHSIADNQELTIITKGKIINFVAESLTKYPIKVAIELNGELVKNITINKPRLYRLANLKTDSPQKLTLKTPKSLAIYSFSFE